ncbi:MAG: hypothetical protein JWN56_2996 [Sphingobacteriales bacterium]|nr:hypothetical protein [Sphingobacteriales bacterium]
MVRQLGTQKIYNLGAAGIAAGSLSSLAANASVTSQ